MSHHLYSLYVWDAVSDRCTHCTLREVDEQTMREQTVSLQEQKFVVYNENGFDKTDNFPCKKLI